MIQKLQDLSDEVFGPSKKKKKTGRGRGRPRKVREPDPAPEEEDDEAEQPPGIGAQTSDDNASGNDDAANSDVVTDGQADTTMNSDSEKDKENDNDNGTSEAAGDGDDEDEGDDEKKVQLTRTQQKKVADFMADLKSLMENLLDDAEDDNLQAEERAIAQKLLLTISVKEKLFNDEHRRYARNMLKLLDGNRRRRCRETDQQHDQFSSVNKSGDGEIREELRIVSSKKKKRKKRGEKDDKNDIKSGDQDQTIRKRRKKKPEIGEDGFKIHSDNEAEWSDVADDDDIYGPAKKKASISSKEAKRRRQWASNDDAATAAGRPWPALPRDCVGKVLAALLDDVIKHDEARGGVFSTEVPRDEYPEYYQQISNPMDYGTMKKKLENGSYRSAQGMQKDFNLIFQNCLKFNASDSDIVKEARQQALMRPSQLRKAALSNNLFLTEDGSVLQIVDDEKKPNNSPKRKARGGKKKQAVDKADDDATEADKDVETEDASSLTKKPRIKISLGKLDG
jgi:Bromodomain